MRLHHLGIVAAALALLTAAPATAQFGVAGGPTFPNGDLSDITETGWHIQGVLGFTPAMLPVGLRLDAGYQKLAFESDVPADFEELFGTLNAVLALSVPGLAPYIHAGVGLYGDRLDPEDTGSADWETNFGLNGAIGLLLPISRWNTFVEARLHHVFSDGDLGFNVQTVPITFGITF
ncbi:MAG: hypothetical protein ACRELD_07465 [Longimicrobiales bacterium]